MVYPNTLQAVQNLPSPRGSERFQQKSFSAVCDDNPAYPPISQAARDQSTQERVTSCVTLIFNHMFLLLLI